MTEDIMHFAPSTWDKSREVDEFPVDENSDEFRQVEHDLLRGIGNARKLKSLKRIQNVYDYGQFLMRSQIVAISKSNEQWYQVRRYVAIPASKKELALKHNLDHRRLSMPEITYRSHLQTVTPDNLIFVVKILSDNAESREIRPYNFTEYYIDYVAEMEFF